MHHPHHAVIDLELAALARWCNGDPDGYLEISAPDVVYFDPFIGQRIDGLPALTAYYDELRGKIYAKHYKMSGAHLQEQGELVILSFHFASWNDCRFQKTTARKFRSGLH